MFEKLPRYPTQAFFICLFAYVFSQSDLALFSYALPEIRSEYNLDLEAIGWVIAISYSLGAFTQVYIGTLVDRYGRKKMLSIMIFLSSLFITLHAFVPEGKEYIIIGGHSFTLGILLMIILRGLAIGTGGSLYPITGAIVTEEAPAKYRGLFAGMLQTGYPLGWFLAAIFAAPLLEEYGWRALFLVGLISIPYIFVVKLYLKETNRFIIQDSQKPSQFREADLSSYSKVKILFTSSLRKRAITIFLAQYLFVIAYGSSAMFFPTYFSEYRGLKIGDSALLVGFGNAIGVLGYILAAYVGEFLLTRRTTVVIWTILGSMCFIYLIWFTEGYFDTLFAFGIMSMFFYGTAAVKFAFIAEIFPTRIRATGLSVCSSLAVNLGIASGPLMLTYGINWLGWNIAFSYFVAIPLIIAGLMYLVLEPLPSGLELEEIERKLNL